MPHSPSSPWANLATRYLSGAVALPCDIRWARGGRQLHQDPFGRLYLVHEGEAVVTHHNRAFQLRPGRLFVIPAHTPSRYRCPESMSLTYVHFTANLFGSLEVFALFGWDFVVRSTRQDEGDTVRLVQLGNHSDPASQLEADGLLRQLLARFAATVPAARQTEQLGPLARFAPILEYVEQHLHQPITLAALAAEAHLQPTYFSNLFSRQMGLPPLRYVARRRIERAAGLLSATDLRVEEVGARVGFRDIFHFSRTFKRWTGLAPTAYRAQIQVDQAPPT